MGRRKNNGNSEIKVVATIVLIVLIGAVIWRKSTPPSRSSFGESFLPIQDFVENSNSLRGNSYQIEGKVDDQIYWNADGAQIISLLVEDAGQSQYVPIQIPNDYKGGNITREQRYRFKVEIMEGGIPKAVEVEAM